MEIDANTLFLGIFRRLSTMKIISFGLHSRQNSENFTMSCTSLDSEMSFDPEDSEINLIHGYEIAAEWDVLCECPQSSSLTSSDD